MTNLITDPPQLAAEVRAIAAGVLEIGADAVDTGKSLRDQGLDSLKLLFLIDALESRFDVRLVGENLGPNDFRSVDSICRLLGATMPTTRNADREAFQSYAPIRLTQEQKRALTRKRPVRFVIQFTALAALYAALASVGMLVDHPALWVPIWIVLGAMLGGSIWSGMNACIPRSRGRAG